jgi:CCR4-NOT transcriptional regulation complex NOT5 subunit
MDNTLFLYIYMYTYTHVRTHIHISNESFRALWDFCMCMYVCMYTKDIEKSIIEWKNEDSWRYFSSKSHFKNQNKDDR